MDTNDIPGSRGSENERDGDGRMKSRFGERNEDKS